jgi:membrane-associated protein
MSHLVDQLMSALTALPPGLILVVAFLFPAAEASVFVGLVIPGETAVIVAGVLAHEGLVPLWAVAACAAAGAILGDQIGFQVGRRYGPALLDRLPRWLRHRRQTERVLALVRRRGAVAVLLGRWTASLRALVPGVAGMSGVSARTFTVANALGGTVWAVAVTLLGFLAGAGYRHVEQQLDRGTGLVVAALAVTTLVVWLHRRRRRDASRDSGERSARWRRDTPEAAQVVHRNSP